MENRMMSPDLLGVALLAAVWAAAQARFIRAGIAKDGPKADR